jgi:hypothetical protein
MASANRFKLAAMVIGASPSKLTAPRWGGPFVVKTACTGKDGRGQCLTGSRSVYRGQRHPLGDQGPGNPQGLALRPGSLAGTTNRDVWLARSWHDAVRAITLYPCSSCRSAVGHEGQPSTSPQAAEVPKDTQDSRPLAREVAQSPPSGGAPACGEAPKGGRSPPRFI